MPNLPPGPMTAAQIDHTMKLVGDMAAKETVAKLRERVAFLEEFIGGIESKLGINENEVTTTIGAEIEKLRADAERDTAAANSTLADMMSENQRLSDESKGRQRVIEKLEVLLDPPVCRLQFPDGSVPGNVREAAEGWFRWHDRLRDELTAERQSFSEVCAGLRSLTADNATLRRKCQLLHDAAIVLRNGLDPNGITAAGIEATRLIEEASKL